jgi:hypothetical protein
MLRFIMNRINLILAAATLAFGGITVHYARALALQRAENAGPPAIAVAVNSQSTHVTAASHPAAAIAINPGKAESRIGRTA